MVLIDEPEYKEIANENCDIEGDDTIYTIFCNNLVFYLIDKESTTQFMFKRNDKKRRRIRKEKNAMKRTLRIKFTFVTQHYIRTNDIIM